LDLIEVHGSSCRTATWVLSSWEKLRRSLIQRNDRCMRTLDCLLPASLSIPSLFLCFSLQLRSLPSLQKVFRLVLTEHLIQKSILISLRRLSLLINGELWYLLSVSFIQLFRKEESSELLDSVFLMSLTLLILLLHLTTVRNI